MRYPTEIDLVGDARETLRALLPLLGRKPRSAWRETIEDNVVRLVGDTRPPRRRADADPLNPQLIF